MSGHLEANALLDSGHSLANVAKRVDLLLKENSR